jgi:hypothetical protein
MPDHSLQDLVRQAAEKQQKDTAEKIIDTQIKIITASYDKATSYTNVIILAGYASFFGLWSITKVYLSRELTLAAAILMCASAGTFVFFEVYKMSFVSHNFTKKYLAMTEQLNGKPLPDILADIQKLEAESRRDALKFLPVWRVCLLVAVITGLGGIGTLFYSLIVALFHGVA